MIRRLTLDWPGTRPVRLLAVSVEPTLAETELPFGMVMEKDTVAASKLDAPAPAQRSTERCAVQWCSTWCRAASPRR